MKTKNFLTREEIFPHQRQQISTPETTNFHTRDNKFPHQRQQISSPETTNFHTTEEIFPHQFGQFSFMPGRAACLLYVEHLLYSVQIPVGLGVRSIQYIVCGAAVVFSFLSYHRSETFHSCPTIGAKHFTPVPQQERNISTPIWFSQLHFSSGVEIVYHFWDSVCVLLIRVK